MKAVSRATSMSTFQMLCRVVKEEGMFTLRIDNFSKNSRYQIPTLKDGSYKECLWTGFALKRWYNHSNADDVVDMSLMVDANGDTIPAMPEKLFGMWPHFKEAYKLMERKTSMNYLDKSLVERWDVNNVPLKPDWKHELMREKYRAPLKNGCDSLKYLYPDKLVDLNVGANDHLVQLFRGAFEQHKAACEDTGVPKYLVLNLDCNIFDRVVKVCNYVFASLYNVLLEMNTKSRHVLTRSCATILLTADVSSGKWSVSISPTGTRTSTLR